MAREHIELPRQEQLFALGAWCIRVDGNISILQRGDVLLDAFCRLRRLIHLTLQLINMRGILLQSMRNLFFEVVNDYKVREERQYILNLQEIRVL